MTPNDQHPDELSSEDDPNQPESWGKYGQISSMITTNGQMRTIFMECGGIIMETIWKISTRENKSHDTE